MKKILTAGLAIALTSFVSQPAQALTTQEALGIGIGVTALTCALSNGCTNQQPAYYPARPYYRSNSVLFVPVAPVRPVYRRYRSFERYENRYDRYNNRYDRYDRRY